MSAENYVTEMAQKLYQSVYDVIAENQDHLSAEDRAGLVFSILSDATEIARDKYESTTRRLMVKQ